ncbi:hypothetical protein CVT25_008197 [Psilocybe cyanescens]|uniref:Uncharacterized protein n=1 Tax=Psilocybe cyanescens TaxID=93625 RepID=A0A409X9R6_PSICY|nr:hypothetical protein CVT25_008197 [Psilocybe cyanescens]
MSDDPSYQHLHSNTTSDNSTTSPSTEQRKSYGCAYLQVVRSQMEDYPTTNGEYLDAIFTHREILYSYPAGHYECARAFSEIAYMLEKRAWRADREADIEAVTAFRHEAWVIASSLAPVPTKPNEPASSVMGSGAPFVCTMPMM